MRASILGGLVLVQALGGALLGCGSGAGGGAGSEAESVGEVSLAVTSLPSGVQCIQVLATATTSGASLATQTFTASANWTGIVALGSFSKGNVTVNANAYSVACSAIGSAVPAWVADTTSVDVTPGRANPVTLNFRQNLGVAATANFAPTVTSVATGGYSTGVVFSDGTVKVTGAVPQPSGLTSVAELALGDSHACVRKTDGTVWCWGTTNTYGELGNGTNTSSPTTPVQVSGLTGAVHVYAGGGTSCALVGASQALKCWGNDYSYEFMNGSAGTRLTPVTVRGSVTAAGVSMKDADLCYIDPTSLEGVCGGDNTYGQLASGGTDLLPYGILSIYSPLASLAAGTDHTCAADTTGHAYCWGANGEGQLGLGNFTAATYPALVTALSSVQEVVAGFSSTCARTTAGAVYCWGDDAYGELGDGANGYRPTPVLVLNGSKKLSGGGYHFCSVQSDASVQCWGWNGYGQLMDGTLTSNNRPSPIKL